MPLTLLELTDKTCRYPLGHPDEPGFGFCGDPVHPGYPYCAEHCAVVYLTGDSRAAHGRAGQRVRTDKRSVHRHVRGV